MTVLDSPTSASRLYERVRRVIPPIEWPAFEADIEAILSLKRERDGGGAFHGRDRQAPQSVEDGADSRRSSRLFARRVDRRRRHPTPARALSRRASRHLRQHFGRGEGRVRYLLHFG